MGFRWGGLAGSLRRSAEANALSGLARSLRRIAKANASRSSGLRGTLRCSAKATHLISRVTRIFCEFRCRRRMSSISHGARSPQSRVVSVINFEDPVVADMMSWAGSHWRMTSLSQDPRSRASQSHGVRFPQSRVVSVTKSPVIAGMMSWLDSAGFPGPTEGWHHNHRSLSQDPQSRASISSRRPIPPVTGRIGFLESCRRRHLAPKSWASRPVVQISFWRTLIATFVSAMMSV